MQGTLKIFFRNKTATATSIATLFHVVGLTGILCIDPNFFSALTSLNMLVMLGLIIWTQNGKNRAFYFFILFCFIVGIAVETVGVHTGILFGDYMYRNVLGFSLNNVPLLIGVNWFIIIYCSGVTLYMLTNRIKAKVNLEQKVLYSRWSIYSVIVDGAMLAVLFDWIMEPVAVRLGFWKWLGDGSIPMLNYISWFAVSCVLLTVFSMLRFHKYNLFAVHLLLIQTMFFLLLRTFLPS